MKVRFKPMKQTEIGRELMRDRGVAPDAWLVIKPNGKRDVLDAKEWDATSASFWLDGKPPEGTEIYPLYRTTPTTSE